MKMILVVLLVFDLDESMFSFQKRICKKTSHNRPLSPFERQSGSNDGLIHLKKAAMHSVIEAAIPLDQTWRIKIDKNVV